MSKTLYIRILKLILTFLRDTSDYLLFQTIVENRSKGADEEKTDKNKQKQIKIFFSCLGMVFFCSTSIWK